jgi:LysM repeat protein
MVRKTLRALAVIGLLAGVLIVSPVIAQGLSVAPARAATSPLPTPTRTVKSPIATPTRVLPTATRVRPTATRVPPTSTPRPPKPTSVPPTATPVPPTPTTRPPTATPTPLMPTPTARVPTATPIRPSPTAPPSGNILGYHVVRSGETLYCIARAYTVLPSAIAASNGLVYPYPVKISQRLAIPNVTWKNMPPGPTCTRQFGSSSSMSLAAVCRVMHTMHSGDTVYSVAARYSTSAYTLMLDNHIANPNLIFPGQVLCIR